MYTQLYHILQCCLQSHTSNINWLLIFIRKYHLLCWLKYICYISYIYNHLCFFYPFNIYHLYITWIIFKVFQYFEWCELFDDIYSSRTLVSRVNTRIKYVIITVNIWIYRNKNNFIISEKRRYELDYRETLLSPKIRKNNEHFNSCYYGKLFDYCYSYVSGLCLTRHTIKYSGKCEQVFHVSCIECNKNYCLNNCKTNESSCFEIYSSIDKIK